MSAQAHAFAAGVTEVAELMRRARESTREIVREDVAEDVRETVDLLVRAVVSQGEEIMHLKSVLSALAREAVRT